MKDSIQNKINSIKAIAAASQYKAVNPTISKSDRQDSLSKVIRNEKEAAVFYAEFEAAVLLAKAK